MNIAQKIAQRRNELGLSQMHVAKAAGHYSSTWLSLIETGKRALSSKDIVPLCKALKLSPEELVGPLQIIHEESTPKRIMRDIS